MHAALINETSTAPLASRSLSGREWRLRPVDERLQAALSREFSIPDLLARLLLTRGVTPETAGDFLNPSLRASLPDPSHLKDMDVAAERVAAAVIAGEKIGIFGDYDVDGATSSALLARFFRLLGRESMVYIPDRIKEGYGPNAAALKSLKERGAGLVITVDCGTLSHAPLAEARAAGLDVIVVDHHQSEARLPDAYAVVNPNRLDETSPHRHLAAVGVAFLLTVAVNRVLRANGYFSARAEPDLLALLDLAALGTVCDVVSLTGVNRALTTQGLKIMAARRNAGLRALSNVAGIDEPPGAYHLGFVLGPRVNAGGRVGCAEYGARLLACDDDDEALTLARELDRFNAERRAIEAVVQEQANLQAAMQDNAPLLLIAGDGWHPGVIGIVAGRLKERFGKPAAVVALDGETGKGSARSVGGFDFGAAVISAAASGLLAQGGGHAMAAGFTVERRKLPALHEFLTQRLMAQAPDEHASRALSLDGCITLRAANTELACMLERAAPFGAGNAQPRLMLSRVTVASAALVGEGHVRLILTDESGAKSPAMAFRCAETPYGQALLSLTGRTVHAAVQLRRRFWQGRELASLTLEDVALA